jgi:hypothetical protein
VTNRKRTAWANSDFGVDVDADPDYGEGDTSTEEDAAFRERIEDQDSKASPLRKPQAAGGVADPRPDR